MNEANKESCNGLWCTSDSTIFMGDRPPAADANSISRNDQCRRKLLSFEFICRGLDHIKNAIYQLLIVTSGNDLFWRSLLLKIHFQYRIHEFIRGQAIRIKLVRSEFG